MNHFTKPKIPLGVTAIQAREIRECDEHTACPCDTPDLRDEIPDEESGNQRPLANAVKGRGKGKTKNNKGKKKKSRVLKIHDLRAIRDHFKRCVNGKVRDHPM